MKTAKVVAVSLSPKHNFSKQNQAFIKVIAGLGVEGDAHAGETVKHRSRFVKDKFIPNLRQVHLIHNELFIELSQKGFEVKAGELGENITTENIDLLALPKDTILKIGDSAEIKITGLRNPCKQIDKFQNGLMQAVLDKNEGGEIIRKTGVMAIVKQSGIIKVGDLIKIELPNEPFEKLKVV